MDVLDGKDGLNHLGWGSHCLTKDWVGLPSCTARDSYSRLARSRGAPIIILIRSKHLYEYELLLAKLGLCAQPSLLVQIAIPNLNSQCSPWWSPSHVNANQLVEHGLKTDLKRILWTGLASGCWRASIALRKKRTILETCCSGGLCSLMTKSTSMSYRKICFVESFADHLSLLVSCWGVFIWVSRTERHLATLTTAPVLAKACHSSLYVEDALDEGLVSILSDIEPPLSRDQPWVMVYEVSSWHFLSIPKPARGRSLSSWDNATIGGSIM